jgi:amino acid transporter
VLLALVLGATVSKLFGMVRIIQLLLLSALMGVVYPAHLTLFYSYCVKLAGLDVLQGATIYEAIFEFKETEPFNEVFEQYDFEDMNFFMNSGSMLLIVLFIIVNFFGANAFLKIAKKYYTFKLCRKLGIKADANKKFKVPLETLFLELYIDIVLSAFLNVASIWREDSLETLFSHFASFGDFFCSSIAIVAFIMVFLVPFYITYVINNNIYALNDEVTL